MKISGDIPHFAFIFIMVCLLLVPEGSNFFASALSLLHFFSLFPKLEILLVGIQNNMNVIFGYSAFSSLFNFPSIFS